MVFTDKVVRNISIIVLYDDEKKILLQLKDESHERYPNHWGFFGGGIEDGETPENAVFREISEELNYKLKNPEKLMAFKFDNRYCFGAIHVFIEKYANKDVFVLNEGKDLGWFKVSEALKLKISPNTRRILKYLIKKL